MSDAVFELEGAIMAHLKSDGVVSGLVGARVYDKPPQTDMPTYPYLSFGPSDFVSDDIDCIDGMEITMQIDCWSINAAQGGSSAEVRKLAGAVRKALNKAAINLTDNALVTIDHRTTRFFRNENDALNTAAVTITAIVEAA